jgi:hypothetical protein
MNKETGGPAFPDGSTNPWGVPEKAGMTLRDYFAAKAMQSLFAGAVTDAFTLDQDINCDMAARIAYTMADAMLKEREK